MKATPKQIANLNSMAKYAEAKADYWEKQGDEANPGSAFRRECFATCVKWQQTAQTLRDELAAL